MNITPDPIWHIAGIGAMGTLLAGSFCHKENNAKLILKDEHQLDVYQNAPLTVSTEQGTYASHPKAINIQRIGDETIHVLICCVKAYDVIPLLTRLKPNIDENSIIVLMHNGLGVLDGIKAQLPPLRIIFGISTLGAYLEKPFSVRAFLEGNIYLGSLVGQFTPNEVNVICNGLQRANLPYIWDENIHNRMWEKFAINCCINLLTALYGCKNGDLQLHNEELKKITFEVAEVISAHGFPITPVELLRRVTHVVNVTANNYSSMYKDVQNKKPTELRYLNEYLVKLAQQKNIATPFNVELLSQFYSNFLYLL